MLTAAGSLSFKTRDSEYYLNNSGLKFITMKLHFSTIQNGQKALHRSVYKQQTCAQRGEYKCGLELNKQRQRLSL
jgi:hypothetical protein